MTKRHPDFALSEAPLDDTSPELPGLEPVSGFHQKADPIIQKTVLEISRVNIQQTSSDGLCMNDQFFLPWGNDWAKLEAGSTIILIDDPLESREHLYVKTSDGRELLVDRKILRTLTKLTGQNDNAAFTRRFV